MNKKRKRIIEDMYEQVKNSNKDHCSPTDDDRIEATWHDILAMIIAAFQVIFPIIIVGIAVLGGLLWLMMRLWR
ncbi:hypothetical protein [Alkaliphilus peptidifermentans]|uniref:Uncharacterized protein n=1 Tax=Alkaliphilus peptidifermentans DSM 18978 TaxID=1120976 RepID=A0A1G5BIE3_9FIRM|nr:hypothetical protein [Alkaliphilus peptidifermentans]SCX89899.1 hypothetical protein SAMN03080606_00427 [Alkaliphilus peptidifermentans DSM 18978]